ncbi:MAG: hypothetical protein LUE10_00045 [Alistipes sp.]|nr:hypothetical protein [Alistipes sp.]
MKSNEHKEKQSWRKYDNDHYALYLHQEQVTITVPSAREEDVVEYAGYSYTGDMEDGGTLIEAANVTEFNLRDKFISGLIRKEYSADRVEAIILNGEDTKEHAAELASLQQYRRDCKDMVDELVNR